MCLFVCWFVCLFVCLGFIVPLENFSLIWSHHLRRRVANFDLCSALMDIEQWGFSGASVYNGHPRGLVTLIPIAERLAVELSLPVYQLDMSWLGFEHPTFRLRGERSNRLRHRRVRKNKFRCKCSFFCHWRSSQMFLKNVFLLFVKAHSFIKMIKQTLPSVPELNTVSRILSKSHGYAIHHLWNIYWYVHIKPE